MRLRTRLITLVAIFLAVSLIAGTGAFSSVSAQRTVSVSIAGDDAALLELTPHGGPNGAYAELDGGQLEISFDGVAADGVNPNAVTTLGNVFNVTNQGTQPVTVTIAETGNYDELIRFEDSNGNRLDGGAAGVEIPVGETIEVTIVIDTTGQPLGAGTSLLDSITVHAEA